MEIIQASGALIHRSLRYQLSRISTGIHDCSRVSPCSILSVKPKFPSRNKLISTTTTTTRAILENSTSGKDQSCALLLRVLY